MRVSIPTQYPLHIPRLLHFFKLPCDVRSLTFEAELAVGRIIRSRKLAGADGAAGDLGAGVAVERSAGGFFGRAVGCEGLNEDTRDVVLMNDERLLIVLDGAGGENSPFLAADEAVGATRWAGSFIGLVGDLGLGLMNPPVVTVPDATRDFALDARSVPALARFADDSAGTDCSSACTGVSAATRVGGVFISAVLGAGVGVGGKYDCSG